MGSHLCQRLLQDHNQITVLDNFITSTSVNVKELTSSNFTLIQADVTKPVEISQPVDAVVHLASPASPMDYFAHPIHTMKVGSLGTLNMLGVAKRHKAKFLIASTSEVYGDPLVHPQPETYWGNVNPLGVRGVYDEAKRFSEALAMAYRRVHGVDVKIARIFNTYGPKMRLQDGRVIPNFVGQALSGKPMTIYGDGKQTRSFCYVDDLVEGLTRFLYSDFQGAMNIGNPNEFTVIELAKIVLELTGSKSKLEYLPLPEDDPKLRRPDISLARKTLRWEPKISLQDGLQKTISWFRDHLEVASSVIPRTHDE